MARAKRATGLPTRDFQREREVLMNARAVAERLGLSPSLAEVKRDSADLLQEQFIQSVKISSAYLNLLIAQRFILNAQSNLDRANAIRKVVMARTLSGLNPGVDSSIANAEVSRATLALIDATGNEQQLRNQLAQLLNTSPAPFVLDSAFLKNMPAAYHTDFDVRQNPQAQFFASRITQSSLSETAIRKTILPGVNLFGIFQSRGSGFDYNYTPDYPDRYSKSYFSGINPLAAIMLQVGLFPVT